MHTRTFREVEKIDAGKTNLKIGDISLKCTWVRTKSYDGEIADWWFAKPMPLVYIVRHSFRNKRCSARIVVTDWGRGKEVPKAASNVKPQCFLAIGGWGKLTYKPREKIYLIFGAEKGFADDAWLGIIPSRFSHVTDLSKSHYIAYRYLKKCKSTILKFKTPRKPGSYDFRLYTSDKNGIEALYCTFDVK